MRKNFIPTILLAFAVGCPMNGHSQNAQRLAKPGAMRMKTQLTNLLPATRTAAKRPLRVPFRAADGSATLWGKLRSDYQWGYYAFHPENPITFTSVGKLPQRIAKNGVQIADGKLYAVDFARYGVGSGELTLYIYDLSTWEGTSKMYDNFSLAALETAQAADGTVYGEFYNSVASKEMYELGTVDYRTQTRTTFGYTTRRYVAIGITSDKVLYGIAEDGNLYRISITDGSSALVGSTGLQLTDEWGGPYDQTGEIDPTDNTFYWYAQDYDYNTALYTVDLNTGAATKIADGDATMYGMIMAPAAASEDAPAAATGFAAEFSGVSLSGTLSFVMPSLSTSGAQLSGDIAYSVTANGTEVAKGTARAGAAVSVPVDVKRSGSYTFAVKLSNSKGDSPLATIDQWVGYDEPATVGNPTAAVADGVVTIAWEAPEKGLHNGVLGNLLYDVVRISGKDSASVATAISATSCADDISAEQLSTYSYAVRAVNGDVAGKWNTTPSLLAGAAIEPDWTYSFEGYQALDLFTVIDGNGDRNTWWANGVKGYGAMSNQQRATQKSDDWLITPPLHLSSDRVYTVSFRVRNMMETPLNTMEVCCGKGNTPEQMTEKLLDTFTPSFSETNGDWLVCTADIMPAADGAYYIGFHDNTAASDKYQIAIDDIAVKKTAFTAAPDSVRQLAATPAANGELKATLSFTAPQLTLNGKQLDKVDRFAVERNGESIGDVSGAKAGSMVTWTDAQITASGFYTYTITPYLGENPGRANSVTVYVGVDKPKNPSGIAFADKGTSLLASWNAYGDKGANGGYINPQGVKTFIYSMVNYGFGYELGDLLAESKPGETSVEVGVDPNVTTMPDGKTQTLAWFAAMAESEGGKSEYVRARGVVVGPNIELPFKESLRGGQLDNGFASLLGNDKYNGRQTSASWRVVTDDAADNDGGSLVWANYTEDFGDSQVAYTIEEGDETSVNMPKVTLQGAEKPVLFFGLYTLRGNEAALQVIVQTPDGAEDIVAEYELSQTDQDGWQLHSIDLSRFAKERYVIVRFNGVARGSKVLIGIDNINIINQLDRDMAVTGISAPESVVAGKEATVNVGVQNLGQRLADGYSVELYVGDRLAVSQTVNNMLAPFESDTVVMQLPVAVNESASALSLKAKVAYAGDQLADNDCSEEKYVAVKQSAYGKINSLVATATEAGDVQLSWGDPVLPEPERVMESFETYQPYATDLSPWTLVDGDKGKAGALQPSSSYPSQGEAFAFMAFNPDWWMEDMTTVNPGLLPYTGDQFAAAVYAYDDNNKLVNQDNWLISPQLSGRKQTVTFYVLNIAATNGDTSYWENFDVLYSNGGTDTADFVKIDSYKADGTAPFAEEANWKRITVEIPEGARYFAIHHNTPKASSYLFGVDDVSYEQLATGADDEQTSFVVYRDGKEIARVSGDKHEYTDESRLDGSHTYNVTVVYTSAKGDVNESGFSNDASVVLSSIGAVQDEAASYDVYAINGMKVKTAAKTLKGITGSVLIVNGKKVAVK